MFLATRLKKKTKQVVRVTCAYKNYCLKIEQFQASWPVFQIPSRSVSEGGQGEPRSCQGGQDV